MKINILNDKLDHVSHNNISQELTGNLVPYFPFIRMGTHQNDSCGHIVSYVRVEHNGKWYKRRMMMVWEKNENHPELSVEKIMSRFMIDAYHLMQLGHKVTDENYAEIDSIQVDEETRLRNKL